MMSEVFKLNKAVGAEFLLNLKDVKFVGWVKKINGGIFNASSLKYGIVYNGLLYLYDTDKSPAASYVFGIPDLRIECCREDNQWGFTIESTASRSARKTVFVVGSEKEMMEWVNVLNEEKRGISKTTVSCEDVEKEGPSKNYELIETLNISKSSSTLPFKPRVLVRPKEKLPQLPGALPKPPSPTTRKPPDISPRKPPDRSPISLTPKVLSKPQQKQPPLPDIPLPDSIHTGVKSRKQSLPLSSNPISTDTPSIPSSRPIPGSRPTPGSRPIPVAKPRPIVDKQQPMLPLKKALSIGVQVMGNKPVINEKENNSLNNKNSKTINNNSITASNDYVKGPSGDGYVKVRTGTFLKNDYVTLTNQENPESLEETYIDMEKEVNIKSLEDDYEAVIHDNMHDYINTKEIKFNVKKKPPVAPRRKRSGGKKQYEVMEEDNKKLNITADIIDDVGYSTLDEFQTPDYVNQDIYEETYEHMMEIKDICLSRTSEYIDILPDSVYQLTLDRESSSNLLYNLGTPGIYLIRKNKDENYVLTAFLLNEPRHYMIYESENRIYLKREDANFGRIGDLVKYYMENNLPTCHARLESPYQ